MKNKKYGYFNNLKYILTEQWRYKKSYVVLLICDIPVSALSALIAAFLPKIVLDCIEYAVSAQTLLLRVGFACAVLILITMASHFLRRYDEMCFDMARMELYRKKLFIKTIDMDYNNYIYNETRVLREKATRAVRGWEYGVAPYLRLNKETLSSALGFSAFAVIIARCNFWFIPILVVSYAISAVGWLLLQKFNDSIKDDRSKVFMQLNYVTYRSKDFSNAKDIRVYGMTDFLMSKISRHLKENTAFDTRKQNGHFVNVMLEDFLKFAVGLGAYLYLIHLKLITDMTIGDFSLYFGAITGFGLWLGEIVDAIANLIESDHNVNDFRNFLALDDKMNLGKGKALPSGDDLPCSIDIENLTFKYDAAEAPVIDKLTLGIKAGERIAIVGVNGAGKSTLVKLISGLFLPQSGHIRINETDISEFNRDEYYSLFSTVFQDVSLLPATIAKNIALCEEKSIDRKRLSRCIQLAGFSDKINSLPDGENTLLIREVNEGATALSGGELQRLLLARALYKNSPIIILDEPTAALDPIAENNMYLKYSELTKGKTSIYISHRLSSTRFCDRVVLLDNAGIAEIGTHDELMSRGGKYAEMFETQSKYYREEAVV